jgi:hypothetical protein
MSKATDPLEDPDLDNVFVLHNDDGSYTAADADKLRAEGRETARKNAAKRKAIEIHRMEGSQRRVALWPRHLTKGLAVATVNRMLAAIVMGEIEPRSAEEAARVAKIADEIARKEAGAPIGLPAPGDEIVNEDDRKAVEDRARALAAELAGRARSEPAELLGGYVDDDEVTDVDAFGQYDPPAVTADAEEA